MTSIDNMLACQLKARDIDNPGVLRAMYRIDRKDFIPEDQLPYSYEDKPLPIGNGQTISQPYMVAFMTQAMQLSKTDKVLEIGTGCGYQAAVMAQLADRVYSMEIIDELYQQARVNLQKAGVTDVYLVHGDGYQGWPKEAPYDAIVLTAAPPEVPKPLIAQLKIGGRLLAPVGQRNQKLVLYEKTAPDCLVQKELMNVRFVPMTGSARGW
ncbi:MAG: protein-L-isoaspartate(D-aspartate) O-methyltransferase [Owenweeksia sp.]|nr:protein-L-isoaspartate(D-aspartate) O-methyltransferase [Owenweeksia sp.]